MTRISTGRWEPPNYCIMDLQFAEPGGAVNETISVEHIMARTTASTCHYFMDWTWDFGAPTAIPPTPMWTGSSAHLLTLTISP